METLLTAFARAWREGSPRVRKWLITAAVLLALGLIIVALGDARVLAREVERPVAGVLLFAGATICLAVYAGWKSQQQEERESRIEAVEKRYQEHPSEPQAAWDLARVKLELYLNHNLNHVRAVFWLTLFVMSVGFFLIGIGVWQVYRAPHIIAPSVVAAIFTTGHLFSAKW
jgi:hypothetical protein